MNYKMDWRDIPSLPALRAFEAAVRFGSLSEAARSLNVTHAAIAQHVRALEADFGTSLLTRQGRGVAPTPEGQSLANGLLGGFEQIEQAVRALRSDQDRRPLQISVTPIFASNWLMPRIGGFWSEYPDIPLAINPSTDLVDLARDGIDVAIRYGMGTWPGLTAEMLSQGDFWLVAHPELIAGREAQSVADVQDLPWVMDDFTAERYRLLKLAGVDPDALNIRHVTTTTLVIPAVKSGLGVSILSRSIIKPDVDAGTLVRICTLHQDGLGYYMVTRPVEHSGKLKTFMHWLRQSAEILD